MKVHLSQCHGMWDLVSAVAGLSGLFPAITATSDQVEDGREYIEHRHHAAKKQKERLVKRMATGIKHAVSEFYQSADGRNQ